MTNSVTPAIETIVGWSTIHVHAAVIARTGAYQRSVIGVGEAADDGAVVAGDLAVALVARPDLDDERARVLGSHVAGGDDVADPATLVLRLGHGRESFREEGARPPDGDGRGGQA